MNTEQHRSDGKQCSKEGLHAPLTRRIIGAFYDVYNELGHGFLEKVYQSALIVAPEDDGLQVCRSVPIPVFFRGRNVGDYIGDVLVEGAVYLELKAVRALDSSHEAQLLNYLRATPIEVGLLLNFGPKPQVKRLVYDNPRKRHRGVPDELL
ncbi:MAG TPA: GxxExxY protein [Gemmataceae bacterium]|nr:GxxExxY protein [Gemmataceae bacterium]